MFPNPLFNMQQMQQLQGLQQQQQINALNAAGLWPNVSLAQAAGGMGAYGAYGALGTSVSPGLRAPQAANLAVAQHLQQQQIAAHQAQQAAAAAAAIPTPSPAAPLPPQMDPTVASPGLLGAAQVLATSPATQAAAVAAAAGAASEKSSSKKILAVRGDWSQYRGDDNSNNKSYWYNRKTKESSWDLPDELKTPSEKLLATLPWKEYFAEETVEGSEVKKKPYYYNTLTKETVWTIPKELAELRVKVEAEKEDSGEHDEKAEGTAEAEAPADDKEAPEDKPATKAPSSELERAMAQTLKELESKEAAASGAGSSPDTEDDHPPPKKKAQPLIPVYHNKREQTEAFKQLLRDKGVTSKFTWEQAMKATLHDPRYKAIAKISEKKTVFNNYKTQRAKEEKEEARLKVKAAKEELERWLKDTPLITSITTYRKADIMFRSERIWTDVAETDRKEIFREASRVREKQERDEAKEMRKRNIKALADILDGMAQVTYCSTWAEAQRVLIENPAFAADKDLQNMDKEDALIVFEEHIRQLEVEEEEERNREKVRTRRIQRKRREAFVTFLDELHKQGHLNSISLWSELYPIISPDLRFTEMLGQPGSTPLDLFKFYVEDLKARFSDEKRIIKDILKDKKFEVEVRTTFEEFQKVLGSEEKAVGLDSGNTKLCYNSLMEKAEAAEKEREREEARKRKRLENSFKGVLRQLAPPLEPSAVWEDVRPRIAEEAAFEAIPLEADRVSVFNDYIAMLQESCAHHHSAPKKRKKKSKDDEEKKKKKRKRDDKDDKESKKAKKAKRKHSKEPEAESEKGKKEEGKEERKKDSSPSKSPSPSKERESDGEISDQESTQEKRSVEITQ